MSSDAARPDARGAHGRLFVVSAPSGTGKTTLVERLVERMSGLVLSRSYTSRPARPGEKDGHDYHFITRARFEEMIAQRAFLEWADVFGNYYGTALADTDRALARGTDLVLVIDVQGARQVRAQRPQLTSVFVLPPSFPVLVERLRRRSKDSEQAIGHRLQVARAEVRAYTEYDYVVLNDEVDRAVGRLEAIIAAERLRRAAMRELAEAVIATFDETPLNAEPTEPNPLPGHGVENDDRT